MTKKPTGQDVAALLSGIHTHVDLLIPSFLFDTISKENEEAYSNELSEIVYRESDLLRVLKALGLPEPVWGEAKTVEEYEKE